jgi:hypothetical protein
MGTESDSLGLAFLAFERLGVGATSGVAAGALASAVEDTNTGALIGADAGAALLPAGWLAAAAMRAAKSLESRFFFIRGPLLWWRDGVASQYRDFTILQLHAVASARHHSILPLERCNSTTLQPRGCATLRHQDGTTLRCQTAIAL